MHDVGGGSGGALVVVVLLWCPGVFTEFKPKSNDPPNDRTADRLPVHGGITRGYCPLCGSGCD